MKRNLTKKERSTYYYKDRKNLNYCMVFAVYPDFNPIYSNIEKLVFPPGCRPYGPEAGPGFFA